MASLSDEKLNELVDTWFPKYEEQINKKDSNPQLTAEEKLDKLFEDNKSKINGDTKMPSDEDIAKLKELALTKLETESKKNKMPFNRGNASQDFDKSVEYMKEKIQEARAQTNPLENHKPLVFRDGYEDKAKGGDPLVKDIQARLEAEGFSVGDDGADGMLGPNTLKGIEAFQKKHNLPVDGNFDAADFKRLNELKMTREAAAIEQEQKDASKAKDAALLQDTADKIDNSTKGMTIDHHLNSKGRTVGVDVNGTKNNDDIVFKDNQTLDNYKINLGKGEDSLTLGDNLKGEVKIKSNDDEKDIVTIGKNLKGNIVIEGDDKDELVLPGREKDYEIVKKGGFLGLDIGSDIKSIKTADGKIIELSGIDADKVRFTGDNNYDNGKEETIKIDNVSKGERISISAGSEDKLVLPDNREDYKIDRHWGFNNFMGMGNNKTLTTKDGGVIDISGIDTSNITFAGDTSGEQSASQGQNDEKQIASNTPRGK